MSTWTFQVVGEGLVVVVFVRGYISQVESAWESPALAAFYGRLTSFCRLILFDVAFLFTRC